CRASAGECDPAEMCTGTGPSCPADAKSPSGTACTDDGNPCSADQCDGSSNACQHPAGNAGALCRAAAGPCDVDENCTGTSTACPADAKTPAGTACTDDGNPCSTDECDGSSDACQHPAGNAGTVCRPAADICDDVETCTGTSTSCPADGFLPGFVTCRASAGECDPAEMCTGTGPSCPADAKSPAGTACTDDGNPCSTDQCDGSSNGCQHPAGNAGATCRAAAGPCVGGRVRRGRHVHGLQHHVPGGREAACRNRVHERRESVQPRPVRRQQQQLPASGRQCGRGVPGGSRPVR